MSYRYGVRQVLHENGFEVPYELVPDGIRGPVHDVYPNPATEHAIILTGIYFAALTVKKVYRTLNARALYMKQHPNRRIPWRTPFIHGGRSKIL
mmetsp:Transcript_62196/g.98942  ORF Transcript_62196/g.98942 Transcript_62196/m.98942 type:complete len:94 (+) Transcript_62196:191-472(+)|eukprot:CAMPEP_0197021654 /NCGR_PEP_ID=MMETSP1384-20130603/2588_1 /TAXON_ID=29189 /ORGANISM="Ammonia sp." /LENGTH=93 /DNA_ID=CAMNT_0042449533 /DNA_START=186 /DNA_END=467 /DNA_ORIENTATION=+